MRRFGAFRRLLAEPRVDGEPWWEQGDCADLIERACVHTPFGVVLIEELFDHRGRPVDVEGWAVGFEGVVIAGPDVGIWVEGPTSELVPVRVQ